MTGVDGSIYSALTGSWAYGTLHSINPDAHGFGLIGVQVNSVITIVMPWHVFTFDGPAFF